VTLNETHRLAINLVIFTYRIVISQIKYQFSEQLLKLQLCVVQRLHVSVFLGGFVVAFKLNSCKSSAIQHV
jgi:hypothetical protein